MKKCYAGLGLVLALTASSALAQTAVTWTNNLSDDWFSANNWNPVGIPQTTDRAIFTNSPANSYSVKLTDHVTVTSMYVRATGGNVALNFDVNGKTMLVTRTNDNSLSFSVQAAAGSQIDLVITSSVAGGVFDARMVRTGSDLGGVVTRTNNITFAGSNLMVRLAADDWRSGGATDINLNVSGSGTLKMSDGVTVVASNAFIFGSTSDARSLLWLVTDPGTVVTNPHVSPLFMSARAASFTTVPTIVVSNQAKFYLPAGLVTMASGANSNVYDNAAGRIIVSGSDSLMITSNNQWGVTAGNVGKTAGAFLLVEDGGRFEAGGYIQMGIGRQSTYTNELAYGQAIVRDTGSVLKVGTTFNVGYVGSGDVRVENGARLEAGTLWLAYGILTHTNKNALGTLLVTGAGSTGQVSTLTFGGNGGGYGQVTVSSNATLRVSGTSTLWDRSQLTISDAAMEGAALVFETNTTARIELGERAHANAYIQLTGVMTIKTGVALEIAFLDNFDYTSLQLGDDVSLMKFTSFTGGFAGWTSGVTILNSGGYEFLYTEYTDEIYLSVSAIPEPGTLGMIGIGIGLAAVLRRRRR
ncbi:MAG: PEP-CTERM sorting domain-containing protein [Kiritimatiellia bacterium]|nr:PEP-CTERM sorting domain-containing protein [Kiritimatiellia bacterium]